MLRRLDEPHERGARLVRTLGDAALFVAVLDQWGAASEACDAVRRRVAERYRDAGAGGWSSSPGLTLVRAWIVEAAIGVDGSFATDRIDCLDSLRRLATDPPPDETFELGCRYARFRLGEDSVAAPPARLPWSPRLPLSVAEAYRLTHEVFFLGDFGSRRWPAGRSGLGPRAVALRQAVRAAQRRCMSRSRLDLLAELTLALLCLDPTTDAAEGVPRIASCRQADGAFAVGARPDLHATVVSALCLAFSDRSTESRPIPQLG
jgi:hypothetical protein